MTGWNPQHGYDAGPPPPGLPPQAPPTVRYQYLPAGYIAPPPSFFLAPYPAPPVFYPTAAAPQLPVNIPSINIQTHHLLPGYNYIFPQEHCKIHVLQTPSPPWQQQPGTATPQHLKLVVPTSTTVKELMRNLGCDNPEPKKNRLFEVSEGGNGKWYKGIGIAVCIPFSFLCYLSSLVLAWETGQKSSSAGNIANFH